MKEIIVITNGYSPTKTKLTKLKLTKMLTPKCSEASETLRFHSTNFCFTFCW